jgi:hypothetical protein
MLVFAYDVLNLTALSSIRIYGDIRIDQLTRYDIGAFIHGLTQGLKEYNLGIISGVCKYSVSQGIRVNNPAETLSNTQLRLFVTLVASSGMRIGEMLGLEWKDIDIEKRKIFIRQQLIEVCRYGVPAGNKADIDLYYSLGFKPSSYDGFLKVVSVDECEKVDEVRADYIEPKKKGD